MTKVWTLVQATFPFRMSRFSMFMGFLQVYYLYEVFATNDTGGLSFTWMSLFLVVWSVFTVMMYFQVVANLSRRRWVRILLSAVGVVVFGIVAAYHFGAKDMLEWGVLADNFSIAFSSESVDFISASLDQRALVYAALVLVVFLILEWRFQTISKAADPHLTWKKRMGSLVLYGLLFILPFDALDPMLNFWRSGYYFCRNEYDLNIEVPLNAYPFQREFEPSVRVGSHKRPIIFLIVVESLNADVLGKKAPNGTVYTPFMNELRQKSVFVDPFYGNSIQTAKGHFALFFSTIPSVSGKTFVKHPNVRLQSLGSALKPEGYRSIVFSAHHNRDFDNISSFLLNHGYDRYETVEAYEQPEDDRYRLKWGLNDSTFFKRFFDYYDANSFQNRTLYTLITIANHFPFNSMSPEDRAIYSDPTGFNQHYANSIRMVDDGIRYFYEALEQRGLADNSLVIVTGDHAFPLGKHGNYHLEAGYHEDSFRIPFFLTWPEVLAPRIISKASSQVDVVPSILDLLNISLPKTMFIGTSVFDQEAVQPVYQIQPYAKHFSVVRYPYKYRFFAKTQAEYVYHLEKDPMESTSILEQLSESQLTQFRSDLYRIFESYELIKQNQLLDPSFP